MPSSAAVSARPDDGRFHKAQGRCGPSAPSVEVEPLEAVGEIGPLGDHRETTMVGILQQTTGDEGRVRSEPFEARRQELTLHDEVVVISEPILEVGELSSEVPVAQPESFDGPTR